MEGRMINIPIFADVLFRIPVQGADEKGIG